MKDILKKLQKYYSGEKFLINLNMDNEFSRYLKKELDISTPEANILGIILFWYIQEGESVSIKDLCEDYRISHSHYLKIIDIISQLESKGYLIIDAKGRKSRILNPEIEVDEFIFKKIVYGENILESCDFDNFYSIIETIKELVELKEDEKISFKYFRQIITEIIDNINKKISLYRIKKYSEKEIILFFYVLVKILDSWNDSIELSEFCDFYEMRLKDKMELMDKIISNELPVFKDGILEIVKGDKGLLSSATDIEIKIKDMVLSEILNREKGKNFKLNSNLLKRISPKDIEKEKKLFFKKDFEKEINKISKFLSKKRFKEVTNLLKDKGYSKGIVMLFYGSPGTGKTATAYNIAKITGREILQVDFSQVQSMWVGESEKNMKKIFDEYKNVLKNMRLEPILLFNEADSLITKRVDVRDSVDQMVNTLQNILLEELEQFEGIFIATTNLIDNIDSAFDRRFVYKLKFEMPNKEIRKKIWNYKISDLSEKQLEKLAEFKLSGGQIDNIAKKYLINQILESKKMDFNEILKYVKEELEFRNENKKIVGFSNI